MRTIDSGSDFTSRLDRWWPAALFALCLFSPTALLAAATSPPVGVSFVASKGFFLEAPPGAEGYVSPGQYWGYWKPMAAGDFNSDGFDDIAILILNVRLGGIPEREISRNVYLCIYPGQDNLDKPDAPSEWKLGGPPLLEGNLRGLFSADFNHDQLPDLATIQFDPASGIFSLKTLVCNGDGTFAKFSASFEYEDEPDDTEVKTGDFNADGNLDFVVPFVKRDPLTGEYLSQAGIAVFLGNGDGSFRPVQVTRGYRYASVSVEDLDEDHRDDLIVRTQLNGGAMYVLLSNGDGTFREHPTVFPYDYGLRDVNHDGHVDLVVAHSPTGRSPAYLLVRFGAGDWTFGPPILMEDTPLPDPSPRAPDFNGDGWVDSFGGGGSPEADIFITFGQANGGLRVAPIIAEGRDSLLGDFNEDGHLDLVCTVGRPAGWYYGIGFAVYLGKGDGTFEAPVVNTDWDGVGGYSAVGHFDGDGHVDLVSLEAPGYSFGLVIRSGNGDGTFQPPRVVPLGYTWFYSIDAVADLNGDGISDIVSHGGLRPRVAISSTNGGFTSVELEVGAWRRPDDNPVDLDLEGFAIADFNQDSVLDIAVALARRYATIPAAVGYFYGNGDGTFKTLADIQPLPLSLNLKPGEDATYRLSSLSTADIDSDGLPDLVVRVTWQGSYGYPYQYSSFYGSDFFVLPGNLQGTPQAVQRLETDLRWVSAWADLNGDGFPEALGPGGVLSWRGDWAHPSLQGFSGLNVFNYPDRVLIGDFNEDGQPDVAANVGAYTYILRNDTRSREPHVADRSGPNTRETLTPPPNPYGWSKESVTISLYSLDKPTGSGISNIIYVASGAENIPATTVEGASTSFVIQAEGETKIQFFARNNSGEVEKTKHITVRIDRSPPIVSMPQALDDLWHKDNVIFEGTATDSLSGVFSDGRAPCL